MEISYVLLQEGGCNAAESVTLPRAAEMQLQEVVSPFFFFFYFLRTEDYFRIFEQNTCDKYTNDGFGFKLSFGPAMTV